MTARDVDFLVQGVFYLFPDLLIERGKAKSETVNKPRKYEHLHRYIIFKSSPVWGLGEEIKWYIWRHWIKIFEHDLFFTISLIFSFH